MARGLNNNNPGNIVKDGQKWLGEVIPSTDSRFKQFVSIEYGYRAIFVNLSSYIRKGHDTIRKIITRWAPSFENNTTGYISTVSRLTGIRADEKIRITDSEKLIKIVCAISQVENGRPAVVSDVEKGFNLWKGGGVIPLPPTKKKIALILSVSFLAMAVIFLIREKIKK